VISEEHLGRLVDRPPRPELSVAAIEPPGLQAGSWVGAPSAVLAGDEIMLAYRLRLPVDSGRGFAVAIARSADGVNFQTIQIINKDDLDAESLERPALVLTPDGTWRLYLSCATWGTKHWRVELLEASAPDAFAAGKREVVLPGDAERAVKDPVIVYRAGTWHLWASVHPLTDPANTDRMTTGYATSADGVDWTWHGTALAPRPGEWDSRGVRVTAARFVPGGVVAYYDGRASAAENFEERTGLAVGSSPDELTAVGTAPIAQSPACLGLRYLSVVDLGNGRERLYYELTRADGLHELRTELRQPAGLVPEPAELRFPEPEVAEPAELRFPEPELAEPAELRFPEPEVAEPAELRFPEPEVAEPAELRFPEPGLTDPAGSPAREPELAGPS
jgi:hypothetical protein